MTLSTFLSSLLPAASCDAPPEKEANGDVEGEGKEDSEAKDDAGGEEAAEEEEEEPEDVRRHFQNVLLCKTDG